MHIVLPMPRLPLMCQTLNLLPHTWKVMSATTDHSHQWWPKITEKQNSGRRCSAVLCVPPAYRMITGVWWLASAGWAHSIPELQSNSAGIFDTAARCWQHRKVCANQSRVPTMHIHINSHQLVGRSPQARHQHVMPWVTWQLHWWFDAAVWMNAGWMDGWLEGQKDRWMAGWADDWKGCMVGDVWMEDGQTDGWEWALHAAIVTV